jgi:rod shape-determining protein MreB
VSVQDLGDRLPKPGRPSRLWRITSALGHDLAVDLGTANTLIYARGRGLVLTQPSFVAVDRDARRMIAAGAEAREMMGRTREPVEVIRPLRSGVISDFDAAQHMVREFILRVHNRRHLVKPRVIVCVPSGVTTVARRAVEEAVLEAGARRVVIVSEPLAAAVGAGLPVEEPRGSMVVDVGGGTTEVAVFVLGGVVVGTSEQVGGDDLDAAIVAHVRKARGVLIGERMAERLKVAAAAAMPAIRAVRARFPGKDLSTGRPTRIEITSDELAEGIAEPVARMVDAVVLVLDRMPPDIVPDLLQSGVALTGGGALLAGLDRRLARETGVPVKLDPEPLSCVVRGAGILLERVKMGTRKTNANLRTDGHYPPRRRRRRRRS